MGGAIFWLRNGRLGWPRSVAERPREPVVEEPKNRSRKIRGMLTGGDSCGLFERVFENDAD